jgi:mRNA interferase HigB
MHVLSRKRLREAVQKHRDLEAPLDTWYRIAKKAEWASFADVRKTWAANRFRGTIHRIQLEGQ